MCDFEFDLHRAKLYEQVADQIQALIVQEELGAGEKLPGERELAESLGVCRTVVREAIRALEVRGLVLVKPGCGTYIRTYDAADAATPVTLYLRLLGERASAEAIEIARGLVPELAASAAIRASAADHETLKQALLAIGAGEALQAAGLDAFWASLVAASGIGLYVAALLPALSCLHGQLAAQEVAVAPWLTRCGAVLTPVRNREAVVARAIGRDYVSALTEELALPPAP